MLYALTAIEALIAVILLFGIFSAGTTLSSLIYLFGFALFATLTFRGVMKIIDQRPVGSAPVETDETRPIFNNSRYAPDYYQGTSPSPTQNTVHTGIPQDSFVAQPPGSFSTSPYTTSTYGTQPYPSAPVQTSTPSSYNPGATNMVVPGVIGGAAGFAIGAALAHQHDTDTQRSQPSADTAPVAPTPAQPDTFMLPPESADETHASATSDSTMLEPVQADDVQTDSTEDFSLPEEPIWSAPVQTEPLLEPVQADDLPDPAQDQWNSLTLTPVEADTIPDQSPASEPDYSSNTDSTPTSFD